MKELRYADGSLQCYSLQCPCCGAYSQEGDKAEAERKQSKFDAFVRLRDLGSAVKGKALVASKPSKRTSAIRKRLSKP